MGVLSGYVLVSMKVFEKAAWKAYDLAFWTASLRVYKLVFWMGVSSGFVLVSLKVFERVLKME